MQSSSSVDTQLLDFWRMTVPEFVLLLAQHKWHQNFLNQGSNLGIQYCGKEKQIGLVC